MVKRRVLLVVDGYPSRKAKKVQKHLEKYEGRLKLYLLQDTVELNPDELVWNWVKNHKIGKDNQIADKASPNQPHAQLCRHYKSCLRRSEGSLITQI